MSSDWGNNEDAGDLTMMGAADYSGHLGELAAEREAELRREAFAEFSAFVAGSPDPTNMLCEECGKVELTESNCHDGAVSWHCGCDLEPPVKPEPITLAAFLAQGGYK